MYLAENFAFLIFIGQDIDSLSCISDNAVYNQSRYCELKEKLEHYDSLNEDEKTSYYDEFREIYLEMKTIEDWVETMTLQIANAHNIDLGLFRIAKSRTGFCS